MNASPTSPSTHSEPSGVTAEQAREALRQAETLNPTRPRDIATLRFFSLALSIALAAVLVLVRLTMSNGSVSGPFFVAGMVVYGLVVLALILMQRRVRSLPRGWKTIYVVCFLGSMLSYGIWVAFISSWSSPGMPLGLMAVAVVNTVMPGIIACTLIGGKQFGGERVKGEKAGR